MGLLVLALFAFTAAQSLLPESFRNRLARSLQTQTTVLNVLYLMFVTAFVSFGAIRALVECADAWLLSGL